MKKMNRKGFVLAEAIVVAVFVLGMFTYLAVNIIPLITKYEQALKYDNPQEVYAANILLDELPNYYVGSYNCVELGVLDVDDYFKELKSQLNIKKIYSPHLIDSRVGDCSLLSDRASLEYCKYLNARNEFKLSSSKISILGGGHCTVAPVTTLIEFNNGEFSSFNYEIRKLG